MPQIYENQTPRIKGVGLHYTAFALPSGTNAGRACAWDAGKDFLTVELGLERFASSNEMGNAATADRIDVLAGCASNVVFDIGHVSGKKHLVFCINPYSNTPGHVTDHL